jgi:hypothetical protein
MGVCHQLYTTTAQNFYIRTNIQFFGITPIDCKYDFASASLGLV